MVKLNVIAFKCDWVGGWRSAVSTASRWQTKKAALLSPVATGLKADQAIVLTTRR